MFKWLLRGVIVFIILLVIAIFVVMSSIDSSARSAIEKGGTHALDVPTTLADIRVGLLSGKVSLKSLQIGNPAGFETPHFFRLQDGNVAVDLGTLLGNLIELPELTLSGIEMNLEKRDGKANYSVILDNLKRFQGDGATPEEGKTDHADPAEEAGGRKYIIRKVTLHDISVQADLLPIGGKLTRVPIKIEAIELENVGSDSSRQVLMSELMGLLTHAILTGIVQKAGDLIPADILGELSNGLGAVQGLAGASIKVLGDVTEDFTKQAGEITKGITDIAGSATEKLSENIGDGVKNIGSAAEDVGKGVEGIGGLLGGKKEETQE